MSEPSLYKPPPSLAPHAPPLKTDTEGVAITHVQPAWERHLKRVVAVVATSCAAVVPFLSPTEDALVIKVCSIVAAIGVGLGITSSGNAPKRVQ